MAADDKKSAAESVLGKRDEYRIGDPTITVAAAANFIADSLFPARERRAVYRRIHDRIGNAQSNGTLPKYPAMPADVFFGWAVKQKGLSKLFEIPGISISVSVDLVGLAAEAQVGKDVSGVPTSIDVNELTAAHIQTVQRLEAAEREIAVLKGPIAAKQQKKDALSAAQSENGKKGGRGNEK